MIIKSKKKKFSLNYNKFLKFYFFSSIIIIFFLSILFFNTGVWQNSKNQILNRVYFNGLDNYLRLPEIVSKAIQSLFIKTEIINLNISYKDMVKLEKERVALNNNAIQGIRSREHIFDSVDALINFNESKIKATIRLKGDRVTHFEKNKVSYRIELKDDKIFGVEKFSLMKPRARNYIHEWLFHELSSEGGLIKLQYKFIELQINGTPQGLYVFEENFAHELIERNKRRNGPIFSLKEEYSVIASSSYPEIYDKKFWDKLENNSIAKEGERNLENFFKGKILASEVLDLNKWFWYFAVTDLTYTSHGLSPRNVKFYYNPLSGLIEPIPYDGHRFSKNFNKFIKSFDFRTTFDFATECINDLKKCNEDGNETGLFLKNFFYDQNNNLLKKNLLLYQLAIKKIASESFIIQFFKKNEIKINEINTMIYGDYFLIDNPTYGKYGPGLYYFSKNDIFYRASLLESQLKKKISKIFIKEDNVNIIIKNSDNFSNFFISPYELICEKKIEHNKVNYVKKLNFNKNFDKNNEIIISKKNFLEEDTTCQYVKFFNIIEESFFIKPIELFEKGINLKNIKENNFSFKKYFKLFDNYLILQNDLTTIENDVYIPESFTVKIFPGQKILFKNSAIIFSDSPWVVGALGKEKVVISGFKEEFGGGIIIRSKNREKSIFYNTIFSFLKGSKNRIIENNNKANLIITKHLEKNNYENTIRETRVQNIISSYDYNYLGVINFYNSSIDIQDCLFLNNYSEDVINIISSDFRIVNSYFENNSSDSIDIDFSDGTIKEVKILNSGNDGIDLSGSNILIQNVTIDSANDKAISVGEEAKVKIDGININNSFIGIASKDGSDTLSKNVQMVNTKIPFAAYRKKNEYNFGSLTIEKIILLDNFLIKTLKDQNSEIFLNKKKILNYQENLIDIVYKKNLGLIN